MITPAVIINYEIMFNNLKEIQQKCDERGIKLRPHFKAHKTPLLASIQKELGAVGLTTAKLSEAELLVEEGFDDILVAYPVVTEQNANRLKEISVKAKVSTIVESKESADVLNKAFEGKSLEVFIKIDTGLNRCGLKPEEDVKGFVDYLLSKENLVIKGLLTHAGHSYKAESLDEIKKIASDEANTLIGIKEDLASKGVHVEEISVGSTPTLKFVIDVLGVTEVRPGNYIFNDNTQLSLNTATQENIGLTIKSTVISKSEGKFIIDAGSKTLGLDKGTHGNENIKGYGKILEYPDAEIFGLSEEHGFVKAKGLPKIGEIVTIVPNHSCVVMNLAPFAFLDKNNKIEKIYNKGKSLNY